MFVDKAEISVKGGDGGNGCCSFHREKFVPKGGPDGGDGGTGGDVIFKTTTGEQSLVDLLYSRHYSAENGKHGQGSNKHGHRGKNIEIALPPGTIVVDTETGEQIVDLDKPNMEYLIVAGGRGGKGNARFLSNSNRAPRQCDKGESGQGRYISLELKTIADIGLVGYPNAGKSTLLSDLSNAKPKTAPYPFTTLNPVVGVIEYDDLQRIKIADIPGLIEGAHDDVGLGHSFLKHIERTKMLAYVLDVAGVDGRNPWDDFESLQNELELYMKSLSKRKSIVIANKMDLPESEENLELFKTEYPNVPVFPISALKKTGIEKLKFKFKIL